MIETIEFEGDTYPIYQANGNAAQFAIPFAKHFCKGRGVDVGCGKEEWAFPGAIIADPAVSDNGYDAFNLPKDLDYIFSSHCLEHLDDWVAAIEYWECCLNHNGVLFLYLPSPSQRYWRPWSNRKHKHVLIPEAVRDCMKAFGFERAWVQNGYDLNSSFMIVGEK